MPATQPKFNSCVAKLASFTLLELMIATVLGAILLLTAGALFMTFMIGNANTNARRQMSAEGVQMLGTLEYHIRNAKSAGVGSATPGACAGGTGTTGTYLTLTNLNGQQMSACYVAGTTNKLFFFSNSNTCSGILANALNSDFSITATTPSTPIFRCTQATNGKQTVEINFTLRTSVDATITTPFSTIIQLRNS